MWTYFGSGNEKNKQSFEQKLYLCPIESWKE